MAKKTQDSFYSRLTKLFKSGPAIQRRVKGYDTKSNYSNQLIQGNYGYRANSPMGFGRENSPFSVLGSYGLLDRVSRYAEFSELEYIPEIAAALDVVSEEVVGGDDRGKCFHIYSDNQEIKKSLDDLFYDVLNVEFNLKTWCRNMVKYGDFFLYTEVLPDIGVVTATPIPVNEIEREEGYDPDDPAAVRFKWLTRGNKYLEKWQVNHFRILSNDLFMPYGTSLLESSRRIARQLNLLEDSMLVYRIVRSPERRVFYIDVGNIDPNDVPNYMEAAKSTLRSQAVTDKETGRGELRLNAMSVLDDYFIPVRGSQNGTRVETISGATHATSTEDVEYIQRKLFAALKVPKPYINFDENLSAKATLSQMDVRFSRTIQSYQKTLIAELNVLAMVHLYSKGFDGSDLVDFELKFSNPSSVALQQKLELWEVKFNLGGTAAETGLVSKEWVQRNILELSYDEITEIQKQLIQDKIREMEVEAIELEEPDPSEPAKTTDLFDPTNYEISGADVERGPVPDEDDVIGSPQSTEVGLNKFRSYDDEGNMLAIDLDKGKTPIKATPFMTRYKKNQKRRVGVSKGRSNMAMPDLAAMLSPKNKYARDINGTKTESVDREIEKIKKTSLMEIFKDDSGGLDRNKLMNIESDIGKMRVEPKIDPTIKRMLARLGESLGIQNTRKSNLLTEESIKHAIDNDDDDQEEFDFDIISESINKDISNYEDEDDDTDTLLMEIAKPESLSEIESVNLEVIEMNDADEEESIEEKTLSDVFQEED